LFTSTLASTSNKKLETLITFVAQKMETDFVKKEDGLQSTTLHEKVGW